MKKQRNPTDNYILLPVSKTRIDEHENPKVARFFNELHPSGKKTATLNLHARKAPTQPEQKIPVTILDSLGKMGAKLINIQKEELADFRFSYPGLRIIREKFYKPAVASREKIRIKHKPAQPSITVTFSITGPDNQKIVSATVVVFTDFKAGVGNSGITDTSGHVVLKLSQVEAERIYVYPEHSYWGSLQTNVKMGSTVTIALLPIAIAYKDSLRYFYPTPNWPPINRKVRVGVIDTGIGPHKDLRVAGGQNLVRGENKADYHDNGEGHGTHVAGIIAADGIFPGLAAGVELMSYRVFQKGRGASNFDIIKALDQAIKDQCDLINMSFGEPSDDEALSSYIRDAYKAGILCFAANGNDDRGNVSFPAAYSLSIAVSAMGRKGTFPDSSVQHSSIADPYGKDKNNFIADFSNTGIETDLTAPGVGIISTYPCNHYAVMDGTSMACPAATGLAARLLSLNPGLLATERNQTRADEMVKYLATYTKRLGFGANFEGKGMLYDNNELHP